MTQCMLCVLDPATESSEVEFRRIAPDESWLMNAARAVFPDESDVRVPHVAGGQSIDDVFTEAHNEAYNARDFNTTRLASLLPELARNCRAFATWWGDDWSDLPLIHTEEQLMHEVRNQLSEPIGDVYLRWSRGA
jgi:hypothetical protein